MVTTRQPANELLVELDSVSPTLARRIQRVLHAHPTLGPLGVMVIAIISAGIANERFLHFSNLSLVLQQVTVIAVMALGQNLIILTAGIDLSVGAIAVLSSILMAKFVTDGGLPGVLAILIGFACGTVMGLLNGVLVVRMKLPPFLVTLGTLTIFFSLNSVLSGGQTIRGTDMPAIMTWTGSTFQLGSFPLTYGSVIMLLMVSAFAFVLKKTAWGKHVYASGDDREAARLSGIRTPRVLLSVYLIAGLIYAVGAWVLIGRVGSASPTVGTDYNLDSITAVVLGGTSLFGGRGNVVGTLIGALTVGIFRNGLQLAGVQISWQGFAIGTLVILAVLIDQWIRKVKS